VLLDIQNEIATLEFSINQKKKQMPSLYCLVLCRFIYAFVTRNPGMIIGILEIIPKKRGPKTRKVFADWSFVIYKHLSNYCNIDFLVEKQGNLVAPLDRTLCSF